MHDILAFMQEVSKFEHVPRTGWNTSVRLASGVIEKRRVRHAETVGSHTVGLMFLCLAMAERLGFRPIKLVSLALVHDFGEVRKGDIITAHLVGKRHDAVVRRKDRVEAAVVAEVASLLERQKPNQGAREMKRWSQVYEEKRTAAARAVRELDKVHAVILVLYYYRRGERVNPWSFYDTAITKVSHPVVVELLNAVRAGFPTREAAERRVRLGGRKKKGK